MSTRASALDVFYGPELVGTVHDAMPLAFEYARSHAKNLSIYDRPGEGVRLTPFYDLMCTRIYPGLSREFAFNIGGEVLPGKVGRDQVLGLAEQIGMGARYLRSMALSLAARIPESIDRATQEMAPDLTRSGQGFAERLAMEVKSITRHAAARIES